MDAKKKVSEAYLSDKDDRKERVVVGLNGGVDSLVTAYLLKIQKYDLIGVTVINEFPTGNSSFLSCHIDQPKLEKIKAFCHQLGIPHQVLKPSEEFQDTVIEPWIASKIVGTFSNPCWSCHEMRMRALYLKMKSVGGKYLATGHYAKVFRNESLNSVFVHTSNDDKHDQAPFLSRLPHEIIESLLLPLSDLQKKEVIRLGENFGFVEAEDHPVLKDCFRGTEKNVEYLGKVIPTKFKGEGEVVHQDEERLVDKHDGAYKYDFGCAIEAPELKKNTLFMTKYVMKEKKILCNPPEFFNKEKILLQDCRVADETPWHEPFKGAVLFTDGVQKDCWIYPKSFKRAVIEWEGSSKVIEGEVLSVMRKPGKNAKIFLTGKVKYIKERKIPEGDENVKVVDYGTDF